MVETGENLNNKTYHYKKRAMKTENNRKSLALGQWSEQAMFILVRSVLAHLHAGLLLHWALAN